MNSVEEDIFPEGWDLVRLEELSNISIGKTPPRSNKELFLGNNIWLSIRDLKGDVVSVSNEKITDKAVISSNMKIISEGTLLMSFKLTLGRTAFAGCDLFTNEAIASLPIKDETVLNKYFLKYALATIDLEKEVDNAVKGKTLNKQKLKNLEIPFPKLEEQKRIVAKIDNLFAKIDKAISLTEKSLIHAKNLLPSVLKDIFQKGKADGWEEKKLKDICTIINGRAYKKTELLSQGKYRVLRVGNLFTNNSWYWSDLELKEDKYISNGDLIYAWSASFGPRVWNGEKVIYHYHIWKIVNRAEVSKDFLYNWLDWKTDTIKKENTSGATMIHVTKGMMESLIIQYPNINTQEQIVKSIEKLKKNFIETQSKLEEQLAYLKQLKSSILSKAFKGEL